MQPSVKRFVRYEHQGGICCGNDVSERDRQKGDLQQFFKNLNRSGFITVVMKPLL
jgi:2-keto-4-pentenoate hydratase/2-oxohepta-3-ene-1,7-dioic acid hydratase in catechol pathway